MRQLRQTAMMTLKVNHIGVNMARFPLSESNIVELKRSLPLKDQIVKTSIAFCNTYGGKIIIGVEDNGQIIGLTDHALEEAMETLEESIFNSCAPHIIPKFMVQRFDDKSVLMIEISEGMNKPYYRRSEGIDKGTYIRMGRHTVQATPEIIQELKWQSGGIDFEKTAISSAHIEDLDSRAIETFLKNRKNSGITNLSEETLKSYALISYDQSKKYPSVAGLLLFGLQPQFYFSEAMIICSHFQGNSGREAIATVDCEGTLFSQFKQAFSFITSRLYKSFTISGLKRQEKLEIPEVAIREALLNLIVHRNYHTKAPSKIAIYDDRVEFFSPGEFPGPFLIENLRSGITYLRNPAICKVLREANYIEKLGSGFITIFDSYEEYGLEMPQIINGGNFVKCILPRKKQSTKTNADVNDTTKIFALFTSCKEITVKDVESTLSVSPSTAIRRLNQMIAEGTIQRIGQKRNVRYRLNRK